LPSILLDNYKFKAKNNNNNDDDDDDDNNNNNNHNSKNLRILASFTGQLSGLLYNS